MNKVSVHTSFRITENSVNIRVYYVNILLYFKLLVTISHSVRFDGYKLPSYLNVLHRTSLEYTDWKSFSTSREADYKYKRRFKY